MIYLFQCVTEHCDPQEVEVEQRIHDPNPRCEFCGRVMQQLIAGKTGIQLKGGGWAKDLYSKPHKK